MYEDSTDGALLDRWVAGDERAGKVLFERHFAAVHRFLRHKVPHGLDDLVQQVFLGCLEARDRLQGNNFRAFLFAVARHQLFNAYRDRDRDRKLDFGVTSLFALGTSPTGALARSDARRLVLEALHKLPVDYQIALELAYWEDLSGPQIAEVLQVPLPTVYSRLRRAKSDLRDILHKRGCAVSSDTDGDLQAWLAKLRPES